MASRPCILWANVFHPRNRYHSSSGKKFLKSVLTPISFFKIWFFDRLASAPGAHVDIDGARNYAKDEGRPLGAGLQEQASNHLKLHRSRAVVVSVKEKSGQRVLAGRDQGDERKQTSDLSVETVETTSELGG